MKLTEVGKFVSHVKLTALLPILSPDMTVGEFLSQMVAPAGLVNVVVKQKDHGFIQAIKVVRTLGGWGLKDAKDLVENANFNKTGCVALGPVSLEEAEAAVANVRSFGYHHTAHISIESDNG